MYNISLIIPVYNVEKYISESLHSALNQTFESIEYIIVDDCGSDKSMSLVADILQNHSRANDVFIYKHKQNRGLSAARNTGLEKATGEYIFYMDSDDEIVTNCIELHYNAIGRSKAEFTVANMQLIGGKSMHIRTISKEIEYTSPLKTFFERKWNVSAGNKLYKKEFLQKNNLIFQEGLLHEDILWSYKIAQNAHRMALVIQPTYLYKIRNNSITTSKNGAKKIDSLMFILHCIKKDWNNGLVPSDYAIFYARFIDFYRLNAALLLLNYAGNFLECRTYYNQISVFKNGVYNKCLSSFLLQLPFSLFSIITTPFYFLYKNIFNR